MPLSRPRIGPFASRARRPSSQAPEGDSWVALVDVQAKGPDEALAAAWQAYKPEAKWPVKVTNDLPDRDGWSRRRYYEYLTSPNEKRGVAALVYYSGSSWTVVIEDMSDAVGGEARRSGCPDFWTLAAQGLQPRVVCRQERRTVSTTRASRNCPVSSSRDKRCWESLESLSA